MASPAGTFYPVGLQHTRVYKLNNFGFPDATGTTATAPYEGLEIVGPKTFEMTPSRTRDVVATGNDRRLSQDKLPSLEASNSVLRTSRLDFDVLALLTSTLVEDVGEAKFVGFATNKQGLEPTVGLLAFQKGKIAGSGARAYGAYHMPSAVPVVDPANMGGNDAPEYVFNLVPSAVTHYLFGPTFVVADEGYTESEMQWSLTYDLPHIVCWLSDADDVEFTFNVARPATATTKIHSVVTVSPAGVVTDVTATITPAVDGVTFTVSPGAGYEVICFYEYSD